MAEIKLNISGEQLKLLIDHLKSGGVAGSGNFKQVVENGVLTLYNNNIKIMEQADDGTWVRTGLYTGANSIHLGGTGTTGSKSHTLTVGGQNVVFINEWAAVGGSRIAFSPTWDGVSCDGETVLESSTRIYAPITAYEPAGAPSNPNDAANITPCTYETEATENLVAFNMTVIAKENYTGRIYATIESNFVSSDGSELSGQYDAFIVTDNGALTFTFENPYWLNAGDKLRIRLLKEDGTPLQVLKGATGQPWRTHKVRRFEFKQIALKDNLDGKVDKVVGKQLSDENFTTAKDQKLTNLQERFLGIFADATARDADYPNPLNGQYCKQNDTGSFWFYGAGTWVDTGSSSTGDMLARLYDPQEIASDVFDRANHTGTQAISTVDGLQAALDAAGSSGGAQTVMGTTIYTEESLDWIKLIELGAVSISVRNDSSISSQVLLQSSETLTIMWADNQSGGSISTINASGIIWSRHATAGVPRNIDIVGSVSGKEYNIKIMVRLLNQGTSSQTVRCSASITMA